MVATKQKRVLIIDDDPGMQDAFRLIFERAGYLVEMLSNGSTVLADDFSVPDIFILDRQLSGVDGLDLCGVLKRRPHTAHVPVIIVSATPHVARLARLAGADGFLEKPFRIRELLNLVEKLLGLTVISLRVTSSSD